MHALVIGVSNYSDSKDPQITSVPGPAISAARFAAWLDGGGWRNPEVNLGSLDVLLSPTEQEASATTDLVRRDCLRATGGNVSVAVSNWADRCDEKDEDTALLFVAGHGTESLYDGGLLLLEDYGAAGSGNYGNALDLDFVRKAIGTRLAHANYFFVDACRFATDAQLAAASTNALRPITVSDDDQPRRQCFKVFYGAAPNRSAYTVGGSMVLEQGTVFCKVLMAALNGSAAAVDIDAAGNFCVSANRLLQAVAAGIENEGHEEYARGILMSADGVGSVEDINFHWPENVPVEIVIELDPALAANEAAAKLMKLRTASRAVFERDLALFPHPPSLTLDSGKYRLRLNSLPEPPSFLDQEDDFVVMPDSTHWSVQVDYGA